ncbi:MAG: hypothetical protein GX801_07155 [Fibrobacter sp.]|nr:hypothetical protein [Fibrobacter sp.]
MKKTLSILLLTFVFASAQFIDGGLAGDNEMAIPQPSSEFNPSFILHLHPLSLLVSPGLPTYPVQLVTTLEFPVTAGGSLVIQPDLQFGNVKFGLNSSSKANLFDILVGGAYRLYFNGEVNYGFYVQPYVGVGFGSLDVKDVDSDKGVHARALAFFGRKRQWKRLSLGADIGAGYASTTIKVTSEENSTLYQRTAGFVLDINITMGYAF